MAEANSNMETSNMGLSPEHAAAAVVLLSLAFLILIRRGFRGVSVGGVGVRVS